jgi:hypothetical protein
LDPVFEGSNPSAPTTQATSREPPNNETTPEW